MHVIFVFFVIGSAAINFIYSNIKFKEAVVAYGVFEDVHPQFKKPIVWHYQPYLTFILNNRNDILDKELVKKTEYLYYSRLVFLCSPLIGLLFL